MSMSFDPTGARRRLETFRAVLAGERRGHPDDDAGLAARRQRYERVRRDDRGVSDDDPPGIELV